MLPQTTEEIQVMADTVRLEKNKELVRRFMELLIDPATADEGGALATAT